MRRVSGITIDSDDRLGGTRRSGAGLDPAAPLRSRRRLIAPVWKKRVRRLFLAILLTGGGLVLPAWLWQSGTALRLYGDSRENIVALSARAGFRVEDIFVEGRVRTPRDQLLAALQVSRGTPILGIDLAATRQRIEELSWVQSAAIERRLPNEVHLSIVERAPIVLWQSQGRYYLVDRDGQVVGDEIDEYADLPLMVGEGAPDHAADLVRLLDAEPALKKRVKAAVWVGERRWNITLDRTTDGIDVRLPEENAIDAWHDLAKLDREQSLLERKVTLIDMRLPDRLMLRSTGGAEESTPAAAKHKPRSGKDA